MTTRTEKLVEQINRLENHIAVLEDAGEDPNVIRHEILKLKKQLAQANNALNESKLIKG